MCAALHQDDDDDDDDDDGKNTIEPGNQELFSGKICKIISSCISVTLQIERTEIVIGKYSQLIVFT